MCLVECFVPASPVILQRCFSFPRLQDRPPPYEYCSPYTDIPKIINDENSSQKKTGKTSQGVQFNHDSNVFLKVQGEICKNDWNYRCHFFRRFTFIDPNILFPHALPLLKTGYDKRVKIMGTIAFIKLVI